MRKRYTGQEAAPLNTDNSVLQNTKTAEIFMNGINDAILGPQANPYTPTISTQATIDKNLRWYLVSNLRQMLSQVFVEIGLVRTIVNVPIDDGLRGGVILKSKQLDEEQVSQVQARMEKEGDLITAGYAAKWARLFGGGGIMIMTGQDSTEPFDINQVSEESPLSFRDVDMWELFFAYQNTDYSAAIDSHTFEGVEFYDYYGQKVHYSRVMPIRGERAPSFIRPRLRGWGLSVVESLIRSINQYIKATDLGFEVLDEFKIDVYKIKNLTNSLLTAKGEEAVRRRVQLANLQKNYQHAITMDSEDDYIQKQLSFTGLAEAMHGIRMQVAADMRMPITKLFGISATGFNSGEDDIEVYNAMIESEVRQKIKYDILKMVEIRCQQMFGLVPDDMTIEFKPLRVMSAEQEENVKTQKFNRLLAATTGGLIDAKTFAEGCNRETLLPVQIDPNQALLEQAQNEEGDKSADGESGAPPAAKSPKSKLAPKKTPEPKS